MVLPSKLRDAVMEVAHDSILGGHLGTAKTQDRALSNFYWPWIHDDVTRYCQSCDTCQGMAPKGRNGKAPLGTMPIIKTPFSRVAIDLIGPLPASDRGNRWVLTLEDCATRYPEAIPMKRIETTDVAEELVSIFNRVGVPEEMLSDRGAQFTAELMQEISRLLSLKQLFTTPYHAMCNEQVERFNGTLKSMVRKMTIEKPRDWDHYIPAVLFAYREVPQESLGFSPFELLYGRTLRGPISILREIWTSEEQHQEVQTTYQYVMELRERLEETCELAHQELRRAKEKQKKWYDKGARKRRLQVGDKVLLLLPTETSKLTMQWKGPFKVIRLVGQNDYVIYMNGKENTFHANMLKKYHDRKPVDLTQTAVVHCGSLHLDVVLCNTVDLTDENLEGYEEICCPIEGKETWQDVKIADRLTSKQQQEAQEALREFPDVLTDIPTDTDLEMCDIDVEDDEKFRLKQYPTPFVLQQEANEDVRKMLRLGIIEPSTSQYASPTVMVRKPDGSLRYCIDFRRLNSRTVFDAEPILNPELVLSRLGKAKYISKMDLTKGFWQIPIREEDRHLTAFQIDLGLMQFRRMPFGLMNALAKFCRMARKLLANIEEADSYVDDIFLHTEEWNNHIPAVRKLLTTMRKHRITARPSKCMIGFDKVEGLGHLVGKGELSPQEGKVDKILQVRRPDTKKELRSFLGVVGYYRKLIENFAAVAKPLTDMTKKGEPDVLRWNCKSEEAYEELKRRLSQHPILRLPQFDKEFILTTDASQKGIGVVLSQEYEGKRCQWCMSVGN